MDKYINQIITQQKYLLSIIKPDKIYLSLNICDQKSLIKYINYSIGYEINQCLLLIGVNQDGKIIYDKKYLFRDINFRKITFNLLSNNVKYVLVSQNIINYKCRNSKKNTTQYSWEINGLKDILTISNIKIIDYVAVFMNKVYSYKSRNN